MLSKRVCEACVDCGDSSGYPVWDENDDKKWKRGEVQCPLEHTPESDDEMPAIAKVREGPPSHCPYKLEHAVAKRMNRAK